MRQYVFLIPEFLVFVGAFWALFAELLPGKDRGAAWMGAMLATAAGVAAVLLPVVVEGPFYPLLAFDGPARFARVAMCGLTAVWLLWTGARGPARSREAVSLALFALLGAMFMAEARELVTLMLAVELATMPAYVLIGYKRGDTRSLEGALKYFLLSMLTTLVMLYGFSLLYGLTGTTRYGGLDLSKAGLLGVIAVLLALVGMFAKLSAAPFHFWAPDAYAGASPWTVAFVSSVPKVAGAVAIVRLVTVLAPGVGLTSTVIAGIAGLSMILGNVGALTQTDIRRMMAYSGVAHTGYLLLGLAAISRPGSAAAIFYAVAYAIPSLGVMLIVAEEGPELDHFGGLASRRPLIAWSAVLMLLSLVGIPPLVGFFGKFYLFTAALQRDYSWLVLLAVVMSVVSAAYYLRIVRSMFFGAENATRLSLEPSRAATVAIGACAVAVLAFGLAAGPVFAALGALAK